MALRARDIPPAELPPRRTPAAAPQDIEPFLRLCQAGRLYEAEEWIDAGRPIQWEPPTTFRLQRIPTPLQVALDRRFHSLTELLLANGYDPNLDLFGSLTRAVTGKDRGLVDLLLRFGADPKLVAFDAVLETCDRRLIDRFLDLGVDPCADNAVAEALRTKARPILGFVKTHRDRFPGLQAQVDLALYRFVRDRDVRGIALMVWLGGNPHAVITGESGVYETSFEEALYESDEIISLLLKRPFPPDRLSVLLHRAAYRTKPDLVDRLLAAGADIASIEEGETVLDAAIAPLSWRLSEDDPTSIERRFQVISRLIRAGATWRLAPDKVARFRRNLLDARSSVVKRLLSVLKSAGLLSEQNERELTRTPAMKRHLASPDKPSPQPYYSPVATVASSSDPDRSFWRRHWAIRGQ